MAVPWLASPADERRTMADIPCVVGTPVDDPAIPMGLPVRSAPVHFDSTGDGVVDSLGFDTTGDGWVDAVQRLQRVDTRQTQHSIADQERKRRAGRQFIEVAQASERNEFPLATAKRCAACAVEADEYGCTAEAVHLYTLAVEWRMSVWKSVAQATGFGRFVLEHKR